MFTALATHNNDTNVQNDINDITTIKIFVFAIM